MSPSPSQDAQESCLWQWISLTQSKSPRKLLTIPRCTVLCVYFLVARRISEPLDIGSSKRENKLVLPLSMPQLSTEEPCWSMDHVASGDLHTATGAAFRFGREAAIVLALDCRLSSSRRMPAHLRARRTGRGCGIRCRGQRCIASNP